MSLEDGRKEPWNAVLFYYSEKIKEMDRIRDQIPVVNVFDSDVLWKPSPTYIQRHTGLRFQKDRLIGWVNEPGTTGASTDNAIRNAPPPSHPAWTGIHQAMNSQFGVESVWRYEEELQRVGDIASDQEIQELLVLFDGSRQELLNQRIPVPVTMTEINL